MNSLTDQVAEVANRADMVEGLILTGIGALVLGGMVAVTIYNNRRPAGEVVDIHEEVDGEPAIHPKTWN